MDTLNITQTQIDKYKAVRAKTLDLLDPLEPEDLMVQPIFEASPPKWVLGHTTWFFENFILKNYKKGYKLYNEKFPYFFNSYYESQGERGLREHRGNMSRPTVKEIIKFRNYVDDQLSEFLASGDATDPKIFTFLELGIQHEQQHQELLITDIKTILALNPLMPAYKEQSFGNNEKTVDAGWISVEEGVYDVGYNGGEFCFDNELGQHKVYLQSYRVQDRVITNREYIEFIESGGYTDYNHWLADGWDWKEENGVDAPLYWERVDNTWHHYTMHGFVKVNLDEPVTHISYYEASAYAAWAGYRLPTEFEWEVACKLTEVAIPDDANFLESGRYHPSARGGSNNQFYGDVWEWTQSAYLPYPGYKREKGALGEYNGKFMINQMVLRGGSCATPQSHIRNTYRNFFQPELRWQFTGIRLAETI